ncbi:MAG: hypothetical protein AB7S99_13655 [Pseudodonghicola sp.]
MSGIPYDLTGGQYFLLRRVQLKGTENFDRDDAYALIRKGLAVINDHGELTATDRQQSWQPYD